MMLTHLVLFSILYIEHSIGQAVNRPPEFDPSNSTFSVEENQIGNVLVTLRATDPDGDPITFSIDIDDYFNIRVLNPNSVEVYSTRGIDYEQNNVVKFTVTATDQVSNSRTEFQISVNVRDLNDNAPIFVQGTKSSFVIAENKPVGSKIEDGTIHVTDVDQGDNADTRITCFSESTANQSSLACNTFDIVPRRNGNGDYSVDIILKTPLDFERVRSYLLPVKAENTKFPNNFTTKNFVINVLDSQDQKPQFIKAPYSPLSNEEQPLGAVIGVVEARDGDAEAKPPRKLTFTLLNDTRGWFDLPTPTNFSGIFRSNITVKNRIDREQYHGQPVYVVAVQVSELFPDGSVDTSATAISYINPLIFDINDNAPEFYTGSGYQEPLMRPLNLDVPEGLGVNTNLPGFLVSVVDIDIPPNNLFEVRMEGFGSDTFDLSPRSGTGGTVLSLAVKKEANLDYEKEEFRRMELTLIATDIAGNDSLSRTATVVVNLIDKNDNFPIFSNSVYVATVGEEMLAGSQIINVAAVDVDSGEFGRVRYTLGQVSDRVRIDGETGVISLLSQPPGDSNIRYEVELVATDGGGKSTTATLVVNFKKEFPNAPKFDSHIYNATVYENRTRFNNEPVRVRAVDEDSPIIIYRIVSGNTPEQHFQLDPDNGQLTLRRPLLKQDGRLFQLTVEASDGELTDNATVFIQLLEFNDFAPEFILNEYAKVIPESTPIGTVILNVTARDLDGLDEDGGRITYQITSGDNTQRFYIDPVTGALSVNAELDFDSASSFILRVEAADNGSPSRSDETQVNITLTDINNRLPRFSNDLYVQYMNENDAVGTRVLQVNAFDVDRGSALRYSIVSGSFSARDPFNRDVTTTANFDFRNAFAINDQNGVITTRLQFSREAVSYISFRVQVQDINGQQPRDQRGYAEVQVNIRQEGVGVPEFLNEPWSVSDQRIAVSVTEGRSGLILTLIARDSITHERITNFREVAGDPDNLFTISVNGEVYLTRALDYESLLTRTKRLIVEATTLSGQSSTATLEVNILNINDNYPVFQRSSYTYTLAEGVYLRNIRLGSVFVTDADGDFNFVYKITGRHADKFFIDNQGVIYVRNSTTIDAEEISRYDLYIEVTDRAEGGRSTTVPLTITVSNTNEYYPVCTQQLFTFFIPRSIQSRVSFGQVLATDEDVGDRVEYYTDNNNGGAAFAVDRTSGVLSTSFPLQASGQSSYDFSVRARDTSSPYYETICRVNVIVFTPETTNRPIFTSPPSESTIYNNIYEESAFNTTVMTALIVNPDNSRIPGVTYYLANTSDTRYFNIDPNTGRVYVINSPDREIQQTYQLIVVARTNSTEVSRQFHIDLQDIDDNFPRFLDCGNMDYPLTVNIPEQQGTGETVILTIKACDKDGPSNSITYYHLVNCVDGTASTQSDRFSIDLLTGEISVDTRTLDYEQAVSHTLCVNASTSKSDSSLNSDQWKVIVRVTDRDDNILQFLRATQSAVMSGNVGAGQVIVQIRASDLDVISPTGISYEILSTEYIRGSEVIQGSDNSTIRDAFSMDIFTGRVTTSLASYLSLIGGRFVLKIRATSGSESAEMTLTVYVSSPSEQLILVIDQPPVAVRQFIGDFFEQLQEIHGYRFVEQRTLNHQDPQTKQTYANVTDVYMYVLDKDGNLVSAATVAEILQAGYSQRQDELFEKYDIVTGDPRVQPQVDVVSREIFDWYYYQWIWWVIIVCAIFLFLDAVILLGCLYYFHHKYIN